MRESHRTPSRVRQGLLELFDELPMLFIMFDASRPHYRFVGTDHNHVFGTRRTTRRFGDWPCGLDHLGGDRHVFRPGRRALDARGDAGGGGVGPNASHCPNCG